MSESYRFVSFFLDLKCSFVAKISHLACVSSYLFFSRIKSAKIMTS